MTRRIQVGLCGLFSTTLALVSCTAPPVGQVCPIPDQATPEQARAALCACDNLFAQGETLYFPPKRSEVDLLLVVGNTPGMVEKQRALATLPIWDWLLTDPRVDLHLAIVSTDVGSWVAPNQPFSQPVGSCDSFAGDDGVMQAVSCLDRAGQSAAAQAACADLCPDRRFVPTDGRPFLAREFSRSNVPVSMETAPRTGERYDAGPQHALRCMLLLGEGGCAISSPLEAAKRALDAHRQENSGFLRPGVPLSIVFLTDRDDCSMQPGQRRENDPQTLHCDAPDPNAPLRCFEAGPYRCLAADVTCEQPLNQSGDKTLCHARSDSPLVPTSDYVRFFSALTDRLSVQGIVPMPATGQGARITATQRPGTFSSAGLMLDPACRSTSEPYVSGLPQRRMSEALARWQSMARPFQSGLQVSVCEPARYRNALDHLSVWISGWSRPTCPSWRTARDEQGQPRCIVAYVQNPDPHWLPDSLRFPDEPWPTCGAACCSAFAQSEFGESWEPSILAACEPEPQECYCVVKSPRWLCSSAIYGEGAELIGLWDRPNVSSKRGARVSVRCAIDRASLSECRSN